MAESITIGAVTLKLISCQERAREYRGEEVASFSNVLMNGRDAGRKTWDGVSLPIAPAAEATLRGIIDAGSVVCSGLVLYGESVLCNVTIESAPRGPDETGHLLNHAAVNSSLSLVFREVSPA